MKLGLNIQHSRLKDPLENMKPLGIVEQPLELDLKPLPLWEEHLQTVETADQEPIKWKVAALETPHQLNKTIMSTTLKRQQNLQNVIIVIHHI